MLTLLTVPPQTKAKTFPAKTHTRIKSYKIYKIVLVTSVPEHINVNTYIHEAQKHAVSEMR